MLPSYHQIHHHRRLCVLRVYCVAVLAVMRKMYVLHRFFIVTSNITNFGWDHCYANYPQAAPWGKVRATCLRPMESNAGVTDHDSAAQKVPEGMTNRHTDTPTIRPSYDDYALTV